MFGEGKILVAASGDWGVSEAELTKLAPVGFKITILSLN